MKTKIVGILVCMLLIATALPAVGTMNEEEIPASLGIGTNSLNNPSTPRSINSINRGGMFIQLPYLANVSSSYWAAPISDKDFMGGWIIYDDFWGISEPICDIHWWGITGSTTSEPGDPTGMKFNISFYEDDGAGKPGNVVCEYVDIAPSIIETGIGYYYEPTGKYWPLYYFTDVILEPCCEMSEGWVSIQGQSFLEIGVGFGWERSPDGNGIGWQYSVQQNDWYENNDFSLVLTDGEPSDPDLECDGELSWTDVKPGDTVTGDFVVRNNGDPDSILHWKIESYPTDWGSNWTFTPNASVLTIGAGWITVDVEVIAPDDPNEEFTGEVKLVNVMDSSDSCTIDVSLATPRNRAFNIFPPFLRFLEQHPHMFPILRHILGL